MIKFIIMKFAIVMLISTDVLSMVPGILFSNLVMSILECGERESDFIPRVVFYSGQIQLPTCTTNCDPSDLVSAAYLGAMLDGGKWLHQIIFQAVNKMLPHLLFIIAELCRIISKKQACCKS